MSTTIDLYRFSTETNANTFTFYNYTNSERFEIYNPFNEDLYFEPIAIKRTSSTQTTEPAKSNIEVEIPIDCDLASLLLGGPLDQVVILTVFTKRESSVSPTNIQRSVSIYGVSEFTADRGTQINRSLNIRSVSEFSAAMWNVSGPQVFVSWKGRLSSWKPSSGKIILNVESSFTSIRRPGLRPTFQRSCRHALYSTQCGVNYFDFDTQLNVTSINGAEVTLSGASALGDGYLTGGYMEIVPINGYNLFITNHVGNVVTLKRPSQELVDDFALNGPSTVVRVYPGCNFTRAQCAERFNNLLNYGGFDWIPTKNPMGGSSIT